MPKWADAFVNSIGVNTHFGYGGTPYTTNYSTISSDLLALHIRHIRDDVGVGSPPYSTEIASFAASGVHTDYITEYGEPVSAIVSAISAARPAIEYVEYPNEWDLNGGSNWSSNILAYGKILYAGKSKFGVPVIGPSFTNLGAYTQSFSRGAFDSYADTGNIHNYFGQYSPDNSGTCGSYPPFGECNSVSFGIALSNYIEPSPTLSTETGWDDGASYPPAKPSQAISQSVHARYDMRAYLHQFNLGIPITYLYEFVDEGGGSYGFVTRSLVRKSSYTAIQNLITNLSDIGSTPTLTPLAYSLTTSSSVHHTLLQKRNREYHLLLWNAVQATDPATSTQTVKITFAKKATSITKIVWQDTGKVVSTSLTPATAISLSVTDRVTDLVLH